MGFSFTIRQEVAICTVLPYCIESAIWLIDEPVFTFAATVYCPCAMVCAVFCEDEGSSA
jgi:hypothetical protein